MSDQNKTELVDATSGTGVKKVLEFFEMKPGEFMKEWKPLTDKDKDQIRTGIYNGTLTY